MSGMSTKSVHGGRQKNDEGALRVPVYDNVAFAFDSAEEIAAAFAGKKPAHSYSRITNPTISEFEKRLNTIAGGQSTLALSSGMAAIANTIMAVCSAGDSIIASPFLFGNTYSLFENTLKRWGLSVKYADFADPSSIGVCADATTRAVFFETISNPQLSVFDIASIADEAHERNLAVIADNTAATPYLLNCKEHGVDIEILSTTKYLSGGGTSVGGAIIDYGTFDWSKIPSFSEDARRFGSFAFIRRLRTEIYRNLGSCISPHSAYLQTLGIESASLRIEKSCANALTIAAHLAEDARVRKVSFPGLPGSPWKTNADRFLEGGYGSILTFELADKASCFAFQNALALISRATNIHDNKTLIIHPASTIFCEFTPEKRTELGVPDTMLRLSVGIEDSDDIIADIDQALQQLTA